MISVATLCIPACVGLAGCKQAVFDDELDVIDADLAVRMYDRSSEGDGEDDCCSVTSCVTVARGPALPRQPVITAQRASPSYPRRRGPGLRMFYRSDQPDIPHGLPATRMPPSTCSTATSWRASTRVPPMVMKSPTCAVARPATILVEFSIGMPTGVADMVVAVSIAIEVVADHTSQTPHLAILRDWR